MENPKRITCKQCGSGAFEDGVDLWCPNCSTRRAEEKELLRAIWENSRLAALTGFCANPHVPDAADEIAANASKVAFATLRLYAAMTAERDAIIKEKISEY